MRTLLGCSHVLTALLVLALTRPSGARETIGVSGVSPRPLDSSPIQPSGSDDDDLELPLRRYKVASADAAVPGPPGSDLLTTNSRSILVGGEIYSPRTSADVPTMGQIKRAVCNRRETASPESLCSQWRGAQKSFDAAGRTLGVPSPVLACLMYSESTLRSGLESRAGAKGLMQFMPATASGFSEIMSRSKAYQNAWSHYREQGGTKRDVREFTADNILSSDLATYDVQIFATGMYFRKILKASAEHWKSQLGSTSNPDPKVLRKIFHYFLIAYNSTPDRASEWLRGEELPTETAKYISRFDACMEKAARF